MSGKDTSKSGASETPRWRDFKSEITPSASMGPGQREVSAEPSDEPVSDQEVDERPALKPDTNALYVNDEGGRSTGPGTTLERQDKGLASSVGYENRDAKGRQLSASQRKRANQLRRWQRRSQLNGSRERSTRTGLDEIKRMSSGLGIDNTSRQVAVKLFRQAVDRDLLIGRSIESVAAASLCAATRTTGYPRTFDELATVSRVRRNRIITAYEALRDGFELTIAPVDPKSLLPRVATKCEASQRVQQRAREIIDIAQAEDGNGQSVIGGAKPASIVAAAIFVAGQIEDATLTQQTVADAAGVHVTTIRNNYPKLQTVYQDFER